MDLKNRINWVDGMLINKEHFKGMEDYLLSNIYTTNRLQFSRNYGIIPIDTLDSDYPRIKLSIDASDSKKQRIIVEQIEFRAISPGGTMLNITNNSFPDKGEFNSKEGSTIIVEVDEKRISHGDPLYLILLTQPSETRGYGQSISTEEPIRNSYCSAISELKCVICNSDTENIVGPNFFPIAKVKIINHRLEIDKKYLPPCLSLSTHDSLRTKGLSLLNSLLTLTNNMNTFIQNNQGESDKNTTYIKDLYILLYQRLIEITETFDEEKDYLSPRAIITAVRITALQFKKILLLNSSAHAFFTEIWNSKYGISFNSFSNDISSLKDQKHYDIIDALELSQRVLDEYLLRMTEIVNYGHKKPDEDILKL